jgi:ribosome-associated toxin RatA of RatAB toxin-antitoxin module
MPTVSIRHSTVAGADEVWTALLDSESYATYMNEVREIRVIERVDDRRVSHWAVLLKGSELEWTEEEFIDHARRRIDFRQLDGDLAYFVGHWQVTSDGTITTAELHVEFDIGIPMMSEMLNPVAARALEDNSRAILEHISARAGTARRLT